MTSLTDRTIAALRTEHDQLAALVPTLTDDQLARLSGAAAWPVSQVLSHLGSAGELTLAGLDAALGGPPVPPDRNQSVWDRWNALSPREQANGFLAQDARTHAAFEALTSEQRDTLELSLGFLPAPISVTTYAGMRLNEAAQHGWDVRVTFDRDATVNADSGAVLVEHLAGGLGFMLGFAGKAAEAPEHAVLDVADSGYSLVIDDSVAMVASAGQPTATFHGPAEAVIRLIGGRLKPEHTSPGTTVTGNITLEDLRRVFPGY
jgi:uncharacterized protein (TIGR03083 family)